MELGTGTGCGFIPLCVFAATGGDALLRAFSPKALCKEHIGEPDCVMAATGGDALLRAFSPKALCKEHIGEAEWVTGATAGEALLRAFSLKALCKEHMVEADPLPWSGCFAWLFDHGFDGKQLLAGMPRLSLLAEVPRLSLLAETSRGAERGKAEELLTLKAEEPPVEMGPLADGSEQPDLMDPLRNGHRPRPRSHQYQHKPSEMRSRIRSRGTTMDDEDQSLRIP